MPAGQLRAAPATGEETSGLPALGSRQQIPDISLPATGIRAGGDPIMNSAALASSLTAPGMIPDAATAAYRCIYKSCMPICKNLVGDLKYKITN